MQFPGSFPSDYANQGMPSFPYYPSQTPLHGGPNPTPNPYLMTPPIPMGWNAPPVMQWIRPIVGERDEFSECPDGVWRMCRVPVYGAPCLMPVQVPFPVYSYPMPPMQMPEITTASYATTNSTQQLEDKDVEAELDLDLPTDLVGASADVEPKPTVLVEKPASSVQLSALVQSSEETAAFFDDSFQETAALEEADDFHGEDPETILSQFVALAKTGASVRPERYYRDWIRKFEMDSLSDAKWRKAMLHDVPTQMVKCLDKIPHVFRVYLGKSGDEPSFLFPCSLSKFPSQRNLGELAKSKNMCLELTLDNESRMPYHLFLRPLRSNDYIEKKYEDEQEQVAEGVYNSDYPSLGLAPAYLKFPSKKYGIEISAIQQ